mgnify:CR=1 FL=1
MAEGISSAGGSTGSGEAWTPYAGVLSDSLPNGFDIRSDEHFQGLDESDLLNAADQLHRVYTDIVGTTSDIPYALLQYPDGLDKARQATPEDVNVARNVIREVIRRAAQNPAWELTPEFLFGDHTEAEGGAKS